MRRRLRSCAPCEGSARASSRRETILSLRVGDELAQIAKWRTNVATLVTDCCERWDLRAGEPYVPGVCGHVVRVDQADGTPAVLKIFWPHHEAEQEADALERWDGDGAVRLLARDDERHAMLLERCEPGSFLSTASDPVGVLIGLLPPLWTSGDGFATLESEAAIWAADIAHEVQDDTLRDAALRYLREL